METKKIENNAENMNIMVWLAVFLISILAIIQFITDYKFCDNHLNWLNHDYCKNLMVSTEENSVFMTEGGDNQVFGTLYFTYAEKLRPDLTPYDQIANIFKKIYGDLRYATDYESIKKRKTLVDTHIFESEEPFYNDIRQTGDPYFIPYWQGQRAVYLTWQRPEQWTLGDYYYKRYGLMYRVQDIGYSLVDYLELKKSVTVEEARAEFSEWLHRPVGISFTLDKISMLEKEGYVKTAGGSVEFVKMYPPPFEGDYFSNFLMRWHEFPNAMYWDMRSREIIVNDIDYTMGEIYRDKINVLREIRLHEKRKEIIDEIDMRINGYWRTAKEYFNDSLLYGGDFSTTLHNVAVVFLNNGIENMDDKARELLERALNISRNQWLLYYTYLNFLFHDSFKHPEHESSNITALELWLGRIKEEAGHYRSESSRQSILKNFEAIERFTVSLKETPTASLEGAAKYLQKQFTDNPEGIDAGQAENVIELLYSRGLTFQYQPYIRTAEGFFDRLVEMKRNDYNYLYRAFSIAYQIQRLDKAFQIGKMIDGHEPYAGDYSFNYYMGAMGYYLHKNEEAKAYLDKFFKIAGSSKDIRLKAQDMTRNAYEILNRIKTEENKM